MADDNDTGTYIVGGLVLGAIGFLTWLFWPKGGSTVAGELPSETPPAGYADLAAVLVRLDELKTLYRTGHMSAEETIKQLNGLFDAASQKFGQQAAEAELLAIASFKAEVFDWLAAQNPT